MKTPSPLSRQFATPRPHRVAGRETTDCRRPRPAARELFRAVWLLGIAGLAAFRTDSVRAQEVIVELGEFAVAGYRTAVDTPAATYAQPVTALRYLPRVDVQARNLAEGQADVAIRGGTFENSGLRLGAAAFWDPQTGHYLTELPLPGAFLQAPGVRTGGALALGGMNATAGEIVYDWTRIAPGTALLEAGGGTDRLRFGTARAALAVAQGVAVEAEVAASAGDGTRPGGDHRFRRVAARAEIAAAGGTTMVFAGRQEKFFAWPYLYAPKELHDVVGSSGIETEDLATDLLLATHSRRFGGDGRLDLAVYHRRHRDDYELDRGQPGLFNPYEHTTRVTGLGADVVQTVGGFTVRGSARLLADEIESTALTFGPYHSRTLWKLGAEIGSAPPTGQQDGWAWALGGTVDDANRDGAAWSPLARVSWAKEDPEGRFRSLGLEVARTTQQPGYTALGSNPAAGLFRGDPTLGRGTADETGLAAAVGRRGAWQARIAVFRREDRGQIDWVFPVNLPPTAARLARAIDVDVTGVEAEASWRARDGTWEAGLAYAWLRKEVRGGMAAGEASFYGLNFPRHRATAALLWRPVAELEVRADHEWRVQERNALRRGSRSALLGSLCVAWVPADEPWSLSVTVDNLYGASFEEVPGVPGTGRQATLSAAWRW